MLSHNLPSSEAALSNITQFSNTFDSQEKLNFGLNCYLLRAAQKQDLISLSKPLTEFIRSHRTILNEISFMAGVQDQQYYFDRYLKAIDAKNISINYKKLNESEWLAKTIPALFSSNQEIGDIAREHAFFYSTDLLESDEDITRVANKKELWGDSYIKEEQFQHWPINQLGEYKIYAAKGPVEQGGLKPAQFFYDLLNVPQLFGQKSVNKSNIQYVVALGKTTPYKIGGKTREADFLPYIQKDSTHTFITSDGQRIKIEITTTQKDGTNVYTQHQLHFKITNLTTNKTVEKTIMAHYVNCLDGRAIKLDNDALIAFFDALNKNHHGQEGAFHCHAGLGRTGQIVVTYLLLSNEDLFKEIFADNIVENILDRLTKFINKLRESRPGLIMEPSQLYQIIADVERYKKLKLELTKSAENINSIAAQPEDQKTPTTALIGASVIEDYTSESVNKKDTMPISEAEPLNHANAFLAKFKNNNQLLAKLNAHKNSKTASQEKINQPDLANRKWPMYQIKKPVFNSASTTSEDYPFYTTKGFSFDIKGNLQTGFLYELLDANKLTKTEQQQFRAQIITEKNIDCVIALGEEMALDATQNGDFYPYYNVNRSYQFEDNIFNVKTSFEKNTVIDTYRLNCTASKSGATPLKKDITVHHFQWPKNKTVEFNDDSLSKLFSILSASDNGILVHDGEGLERSEHIIAMFILAKEDVFSDIFADDNTENIANRLNKLIDALSESRPKFDAGRLQLHQIISDVARYKKLNNDLKAILSDMNVFSKPEESESTAITPKPETIKQQSKSTSSYFGSFVSSWWNKPAASEKPVQQQFVSPSAKKQ